MIQKGPDLPHAGGMATATSTGKLTAVISTSKPKTAASARKLAAMTSMKTA